MGHGSNFLLNIGPDHRGLLPEADAKRLLELGERIRASFGTPLPYGEVKREGATYTMEHSELGDPDWKMPRAERLSNCIVLQEDLTSGQHITAFHIYGYLPNYKKKRILLFEGRTVGHKVICRFGTLRCSKFEVEIEGNEGATLASVQAFYIK